MGDLKVYVIEASNLIAADKNGKSDPFVTLEILEAPMQGKQKTKVRSKTLHPSWNESFNFRVPAPNSTLILKVWDHDMFSKNDPLGNASVNLSTLTPGIANNMWLDLKGVAHGKLRIELFFNGGQQPQTYQPQAYVQAPPAYYPPPAAPVHAPAPVATYSTYSNSQGNLTSAPSGTFSPVPPPKPASRAPPTDSYPPPTSSYTPQTSSYDAFNQGYPPQQAYPPPQQEYYPPPQQQYPPQPQPTYAYPQAPAVGDPNVTRFFVSLQKKLPRDYIVLLDQSGSMEKEGRWQHAKEAIKRIAPSACQADPDGITLYLFHTTFKKYSNIQNANAVHRIFDQQRPDGSTKLHTVLASAFKEHFEGSKPTTILVITDGAPDSQRDVITEIVQATKRMRNPEELSISFIQIGNDTGAVKFLQYLDDKLIGEGATYDIVDTVSATKLGAMTFDELIQKSLTD